MRKAYSKQRECSISEKVRKRFRYSPSFQAQKCYSKLHSRYNINHHKSKPFDQDNNQINCQYSSVKQKNIQTNECNDTSSWIAKLVNGIQDEDEQNKNLQKLSQIQNRSVSDLPEDSKDFQYNQFLSSQGDKLFTQKTIQKIDPSNQKYNPQPKIIKKSVKQTLIEIQQKQNKQGMKVPHVSKVNSCSKRNNSNNGSKKNSLKRFEVENKQLQELTSIMCKSNNYKKKVQGNIKISRNFSRVKSLQNVQNKTLQISTLNISNQQTIQERNLKDSKPNTVKKQITKKGTSIYTDTKKQSLSKIMNVFEDYPTRKNSMISKQELSDTHQQYNIVEEHSKNLKVQNLFSEKDQCPQQNNEQNYTELIEPIFPTKKIGGIKRNIRRNSESIYVFEQVSKQVQKDQFKDIPSKQSDNVLDELKLKYNYQSSHRQLDDFTLCQRNKNQRIYIDLEDNIISSFRFRKEQPKYKEVKQVKYQEMIKKGQQKKEKQVQRVYNNRNSKQYQNQSVNIKITSLFNKIKLNPSLSTISKTNIKLRGLNQQEKAELGSIITKIHYQNAQFDLQSFKNQFIKMNYQCTLKACLSQEKIQLKQNSNSVQQQIYKNNPKSINRQEQIFKKKDIQSFDENQQLQKQYNDKDELMIDRKRNSRVIKKKLFDQIKRISYLQQIAASQLQKNSRISEVSKSNLDINHQKSKQRPKFNIYQTEQIQNICKDPYVQGPSLSQIQITNRSIQSSSKQKDFSSIRIRDTHQKSNKKQTNENQFYMPQNRNGSIIQKLNKKLTSYIDKNQIQNTYRNFNLNFSQLKKHIR